MLSLFPDAAMFCFDISVKKIVPRAQIVRLPFSSELMPKSGKDNVLSRAFVSFTRDTPSKNHAYLRQVVGNYPLCLFRGYTFEDMANEYTKAVAMLDASSFPKPHRRVQYSILEAWYYGCPVLCFPEWFCDELYPEETCLELNEENVARVWYDYLLCSKLAQNGNAMLNLLHNANDVRTSMENFL